MEEYIVSERDLEICIRWSEVHTNKIIKNFNYFNSSNDEYFYEHENKYLYEYDLDIIKINIYNKYKNRLQPEIKVIINEYEDDIIVRFEVISLSDIREIFKEYLSKIRLCSCKRLSRMDHQIEELKGKCNNCYIYGYVKGEMCSICMLDDHKPWLETKCKHQFHDLCWYKMKEHSLYESVKCPLCRTENYDDDIHKL